MNLVERFFADLTEDCVRDGSFASVKELKDPIVAYLDQRNRAPKPYRWKAQRRGDSRQDPTREASLAAERELIVII